MRRAMTPSLPEEHEIEFVAVERLRCFVADYQMDPATAPLRLEFVEFDGDPEVLAMRQARCDRKQRGEDHEQSRGLVFE
jgi:hypothetical protein